MKQNLLFRPTIVLGLLVAGCTESQEGLAGPSAENSVESPRGSILSVGGADGTSALTTTATSIPFAPYSGPFNHGYSCSADCVFQGQEIGFSFAFFGHNYTTFNLSSNGFIGFGPSTAQGCCEGGNIPAADGLNNIIAAAWTHLLPPGHANSQIYTQISGIAPARYLVVEYRDVAWHDDPGQVVTTQIILYEGSNIIEIHTTNQPAGHVYTQGVEDATGTQAAFLPGRVAADYALVNDAVRFTTGSGTWLTRAAMPAARRGLSVAAVTGVLYAIGGNTGPGAALRTVQAYNTSTNAWSSKASLPAPRQSGNGATSIGGKIYVAGGQDAAGTLTRSLYMYNPSTNVWATKASMPVVGGCGGSASINGKLYVFSGCSRSSTGAQMASALLHRYDPATNIWTTLRPGPTEHFQPAVAATGGKLYVVGGSTNAGALTNRLEVYNPATNTWSTKANIPTARIGAAGAVAGGKLYVFGGRMGTAYLNRVEAYDPISNTWSGRADLLTARAALGVGMVSNKLYAMGGRNASSVFSVNEQFTP